MLQTVDSILKEYNHGLATYAKVSEVFNAEMVKGLSKAGNAESSIKMLITYVRNLPSGDGA